MLKAAANSQAPATIYIEELSLGDDSPPLAPVVNVRAPEVRVEPPAVHVNVEQPPRASSRTVSVEEDDDGERRYVIEEG